MMHKSTVRQRRYCNKKEKQSILGNMVIFAVHLQHERICSNRFRQVYIQPFIFLSLIPQQGRMVYLHNPVNVNIYGFFNKLMLALLFLAMLLCHQRYSILLCSLVFPRKQIHRLPSALSRTKYIIEILCLSRF